MVQTVLIIGATGGVGGAAAKAYAAHGWSVRAMHRDPGSALASLLARGDAGWAGDAKWVRGDALNSGDVLNAAEGVDVIFHGANPPGYTKWKQKAVPMLKHAIAAAKVSGATLVFPGNVYNYGPDAWPVLSETSPQKPITGRGKIRVQMEKLLEKASGRNTQVLIVRAGDFFSANAPGSWFQNAMVKPGKKIRAVTYPGYLEVGHAWAYLPDLAEAMVLLSEKRDTFGAFERFNFAGHYLERGAQMPETILKIAGRPKGKIKKLPWPLIRLAWPFNGTFRGLLQMRYLWTEDIRLDNAKLIGVLGKEPHTPLEEAVRETLEGLECL